MGDPPHRPPGGGADRDGERHEARGGPDGRLRRPSARSRWSPARACARGAARSAGYAVTPIDVGPRPAGAAQALERRARRRVQRAARPLRRGRPRPGPARPPRHPLHPLGVLASALAMDKPMAKRLFAERRPALPEGVAADAGRGAERRPAAAPVRGQAGDRGLQRRRAHRPQSGNARPLDGIELAVGESSWSSSYIPGRELTVAVLGDRAAGGDRDPRRRRFYDYDAKYTDGVTVASVPGAAARGLVRGGDAHGAGRAPGAGLPRRDARRLPLRRPKGDDAASCICSRSTPSPA